jgi:hypothetical protein
MPCAQHPAQLVGPQAVPASGVAHVPPLAPPSLATHESPCSAHATHCCAPKPHAPLSVPARHAPFVSQQPLGQVVALHAVWSTGASADPGASNRGASMNSGASPLVT